MSLGIYAAKTWAVQIKVHANCHPYHLLCSPKAENIPAIKLSTISSDIAYFFHLAIR